MLKIIRVGHRGAAGLAPENTLAAIRAGLASKVDFIEVDVQSSRDGRFILMHDLSVDRTTNGTGLVSELTWAELQSLDAGNKEPVPSVEDALATVAGRAGIMLEMKSSGIGPALHQLVQRSGFPGPVLYACFHHADLLAIHEIDPLAQTLALLEVVPNSGPDFALQAGATLVGLNHEFATPESLDTLHAAGLQIFLYTVNDAELIQHAIRLGVDGIISDFPDRLPA